MEAPAFVELLRPIADRLRAVDIASRGAVRQVEHMLPFWGVEIVALRGAALAARNAGWLLPKEQAGIRFGRVTKDLHGFSVDAVLMDRAGPRHRHPNGEIDLCFATEGRPSFDGHPEGWVVYPPDSVHVPTVTCGEMLILYFLPGAAIEFLGG